MIKKAGLIRCQNYSKSCAGQKDYQCAAAGLESFAETGPVEINAVRLSCQG